jgi:hypothetical protein
MEFVQIVDCRTNRPDDLITLGAEWEEMEPGPNTPTRSYVCRDRDDASHFVIVAVFESHEKAMANSAARETDLMAQRMKLLVDGEPSFTNLDVIQIQSA